MHPRSTAKPRYGIADPVLATPKQALPKAYSSIPKRGNCPLEYAFGKAKYNLIHTTQYQRSQYTRVQGEITRPLRMFTLWRSQYTRSHAAWALPIMQSRAMHALRARSPGLRPLGSAVDQHQNCGNFIGFKKILNINASNHTKNDNSRVLSCMYEVVVHEYAFGKACFGVANSHTTSY